MPRRLKSTADKSSLLKQARTWGNTFQRVFASRLRIHSLQLQREGRIESVKRHRRWQAGLDRDQFFDQVFGKDR